MKIVMLGPQGSGKGTQAELLVKKYGFAMFTMGDALREKSKEDSEVGRLVRDLIDNGKLVPNEITNGLIKNFIETNEKWIIEGYPRNIGQAEFLDSVTMPDVVVVLELSDAAAVERLGGRRVCPDGHNYHVQHKPPKKEGVCDIDGKQLQIRDDDTPDAIRKRLQWTHEKTAEVIEHYKDLVLKIDGNQSIEDVHRDIVEKLEL